MPKYAVAALVAVTGQFGLSYDYRFEAASLVSAVMHLQDRGAVFYGGPMTLHSMASRGLGTLYPILHTWPHRFLVEFEDDA